MKKILAGLSGGVDSAAAVMFCSRATAKKYSNNRSSIKISSQPSIGKICIRVNAANCTSVRLG